MTSNGRAVAINPDGSLLQACGARGTHLYLSPTRPLLSLGVCGHPRGGFGARRGIGVGLPRPVSGCGDSNTEVSQSTPRASRRPSHLIVTLAHAFCQSWRGRDAPSLSERAPGFRGVGGELLVPNEDGSDEAVLPQCFHQLRRHFPSDNIADLNTGSSGLCMRVSCALEHFPVHFLVQARTSAPRCSPGRW